LLAGGLLGTGLLSGGGQRGNNGLRLGQYKNGYYPPPAAGDEGGLGAAGVGAGANFGGGGFCLNQFFKSN
jgi:hypothetical protein